MATARYLVHDVAAAAVFSTEALGFAVRRRFGPAMAIVVRGDNDLCEDPQGKAVELFEPGKRG